jgi:glycosyltransferase involved in cell wall biosynthesis
MATVPRVSVVIPCFNEEANIGRCLDSLLSQKAKPHEIIVVDGGSKDRTAEIVKSFQKRSGRLKLLHENANRSPANARNIGWKASTGDYILFLDSDWEFDIGFLQDVQKAILGKFEGKLAIRHPAISSIGGVFRRYSWYGRTMPRYWMKNKTDLKTLFRMVMSACSVILPLMAVSIPSSQPVIYATAMETLLIALVGIKNALVSYRKSRDASFFITMPAYMAFIFVSTGIGIISIPFLMASGRYRTGR